jgi:hypothetical protein
MKPSFAVPDSSRSAVELEIAAFHQPAIDRARKMIFWAGMIYALFPLLMFAMFARLTGPGIFATWPFVLMFGGGCAIWGLHIALAWWAKRQPLPATSVAFGVFVAYVVVLVALGELTNPIVPAIGTFILGRGVLAAWRAHKLRTAAP